MIDVRLLSRGDASIHRLQRTLAQHLEQDHPSTRIEYLLSRGSVVAASVPAAGGVRSFCVGFCPELKHAQIHTTRVLLLKRLRLGLQREGRFRAK